MRLRCIECAGEVISISGPHRDAATDWHTKKPHLVRSAAFLKSGRLTLGELEALAGSGLTSLFAFLHPWVTGKETKRLDGLAVFWIHLGKGAGDRVADRNGLSLLATAFDDDVQVKLVGKSNCLERREHRVLKLDRRKVFLEGASIDGDLAGAFGHPDAGDCGFAAAGGALGGGGGHFEMSGR